AIEEIFFATSPSAKTLRADERQPFKERWLGRYLAYDIESLRLCSEVGADAVAFAEYGATESILPFRPRSLRRPFLGGVADSRIDLAGLGVGDVLMRSGNVSHTRFGKPPREGISQQAGVAAARDVHQDMKVLNRHRLAHKNGVEGFVWSVPSRPDTESIPSSVDQRDVTLRCQMLS